MPISPSCDKSPKPTRSNVGKSITRIHHEISLPQRDVLAREGFKVPPITPRLTKAPGWKLGSGFDGITLQPSANKKPRNRNVGYPRDSCFPGRSFPELELSTAMSPTRQPAGQRSIPKSQKNQAGLVATDKIKLVQELGIADGVVKFGLPRRPTKTSENAASVQAASSTALRERLETEQSETASSSYHDGAVRKHIQLHLSQNMYLGTRQSIREPSKSEHSCWLKRKSAASDKDEDDHFLIRTPTKSVSASGRRSDIGKGHLRPYSEEMVRAQHAAVNDVHAFIEDGRTRPTSDQLVTPSQKQDVRHDEPSAKQRGPRVLHDAGKKSSSSEEDPIGGQRSSRPLVPQVSLHSKAKFPISPMHPQGLPMLNARRHIEGFKNL